MDFTAVDVETANPDMASICQIGIVKYKAGQLTDEWASYIDPEDYFDGMNVSIHRIDEAVVRGAPKFYDIADRIHSLLDDTIVVCHTHFDRVAIHQAAQRYSLAPPKCTWLDSARVARRTWTECASTGYGLRDVCTLIGYDFQHHDALADAKASAHIILSAVAKSGIDLSGWTSRVRQPIGADGAHAVTRDGNPEGDLYGEVLVFTGSLALPRREAADLAASAGCQVAAGVTRRTTLLVVGDQDLRRLGGHDKSTKHRKAERLIAEGSVIRILKESDFKELVKLSSEFG